MIKTEFMYVDDIPVVINGEKNMLQLIRKTGVKLPTFCYHTDLSIYGACRMCMVEDEKGNLYTACSTPPKAGLKIKTNTARLRRYRKNILELLLANHCRDCTTCVNNKACKLQDLAVRFNIEGVRFPNRSDDNRVTNSSSCITFDSGKCILCGDCVRTCHEVQNVGAIDFAYRGSKMVISTAFGKPLSETPCVGCGQCAVACPTGAIMPKSDIARVWNAIADPNVKTVVQVAPAVRVAMGNMEGVKEGLNDFSNYLLYNFEDKPDDLYERIKINVNLCEELNVSIYSFPMKYHPIKMDKDWQEDFSHNRNYIGKHWNRKYIRAIQAILNSTKGKIGRGQDFFRKALGKDLEEYKKILDMPETFIIYRFFFDWMNSEQAHSIALTNFGDDSIWEYSTEKWWNAYLDCQQNLTAGEWVRLLTYIRNNNYDLEYTGTNEISNTLIWYYNDLKKDIIIKDSPLYIMKKEYDRNPLIEVKRHKHFECTE